MVARRPPISMDPAIGLRKTRHPDEPPWAKGQNSPNKLWQHLAVLQLRRPPSSAHPRTFFPGCRWRWRARRYAGRCRKRLAAPDIRFVGGGVGFPSITEKGRRNPWTARACEHATRVRRSSAGGRPPTRRRWTQQRGAARYPPSSVRLAGEDTVA